MLLPIYKITKYAPVKIKTTGKGRNAALRICELLFPVSGVIDICDGIKLDCANKNEKLLFYFFYNVLRYYSASPLFRYMKKKLCKNDIFLDIGANLGVYSYLAQKIGCKVYVFEPEPSHLAYLKRNKHLFDGIFDFALSNDDGEVDFYIGDSLHLTASSLIMSNRGLEKSDYSHRIKVHSKRFDNLLILSDIANNIKLIKVDVEGAEQNVVEGMPRFLAQHKVDIWCEVRGEQSDRNPGSYRKVCHFLKQFGYHSYIFDGINMHRFSDKDTRKVFDVLFIQ